MSASPTTLGRYTVVRMLAKGGMADLWLARADGLGGFERYVVIKRLREAQARDPRFVQMFVAEARLAGVLHHHNIIQVQDIGEQDGRPYFAMEYVHGEDLRKLLRALAQRGEKTPLHHVVAIIGTVAAALHHAHEQKGPDRKPLGIIHRDVTPSNILVGYDGNVKVLDFGIAKAVLTVDTEAGVRKGKVPYMSPEQCEGKPADRRADVFSLGIVLYELCTVRRLYKGASSHDVMRTICQGIVPKPSAARDDLPPALEAIIMKALANAPADRYQTADEMRLALDDFAASSKLSPSTSALAKYMKELFGDRPEPWLTTDKPEAANIDFDGKRAGLAELPKPTRKALPKLAPTPATEARDDARTEPQAVPIVAPPILPRGSSQLEVDAAIAAQAPISGERALTEPEPRTVVATPPPMPTVIVGVKTEGTATVRADAESTEIVAPLSAPPGAEITAPAPLVGARRWLVGGLIAAIAIVGAGVVLIVTRDREDEPARPAAAKTVPREPAKPATAESPAPTEAPPPNDPVKTEPAAETVHADVAPPSVGAADVAAAHDGDGAAHAVSPPSPAATADVANTVAAANPTDPAPAPAPSHAVVPAKPKIATAAKTSHVAKPEHKPTKAATTAKADVATETKKPAKPKSTKPPAWDPDALFLKK